MHGIILYRMNPERRSRSASLPAAFPPQNVFFTEKYIIRISPHARKKTKKTHRPPHISPCASLPYPCSHLPPATDIRNAAALAPEPVPPHLVPPHPTPKPSYTDSLFILLMLATSASLHAITTPSPRPPDKKAKLCGKALPTVFTEKAYQHH